MFVQPIRWTEEKLSHDADISTMRLLIKSERGSKPSGTMA